MLEAWWRRARAAGNRLLARFGLDRYMLLDRIARKDNTIAHLFGLLCFYLGISLMIPCFVASYYDEDVKPWLYPILLAMAIGVPLLLRYKSAERARPTEAMFVVAMAWLVAMVFGAIPFVLYGLGMLDAMFESMSGFTTTGSSILADTESWPKSLLFWRSLSQWLGGAGIIMIFVAVLPMLGVGGRVLAKRESPGMEIAPLSLRIQEEVRKFAVIFIVLSGLQLLLLLLTGIGIYDSFAVMFSTMSTGGFSPHSQSIAYYGSPAVEWIVIVFMFLGGTSFYLHFHAITSKDWRLYWHNSEFRAYSFLTIAATAIIFALLWDQSFEDMEASLRTSLFQVISVFTTTGFATTDFILWDKAAVFLLFALMFIGACSGSTAGGIKTIRFILAKGFITSVLYKAVHPRAMYSVKLDGRSVGESTMSSLLAVVICYLATVIVSTVALVLIGIDPTTSMSAAIATLSNEGPALGSLGPMGNFGALPDPAKIILIFNMWAGRLEFISVFVILTRPFWKELLRYRKPGE
jgi:trk system potassium uptake protein TrkH